MSATSPSTPPSAPSPTQETLDRSSIVEHREQCKERFKEQRESIKQEIEQNKWLQNENNLKNYSDFMNEIWCDIAHEKLEKVNESTLAFFEGGEGKEAIVQSVHPEYREWVPSVLKGEGIISKKNRTMVEEIMMATLKKYKLDAKNVNKESFKEETKTKMKEDFKQAIQNAEAMIKGVLEQIARSSLRRDTETQIPTLSLEEITSKLSSKKTDELYLAALREDNQRFIQELYVNLGTLNESQKINTLIRLYLDTEKKTQTDLNDSDQENLIVRKGCVIAEIQNLGGVEKEAFVYNLLNISKVPDWQIRQRLDELISLGAIWPLSVDNVFQKHPELAEKFHEVRDKIKNGAYKRELQATPEDIAAGRTEGLPKEKINALNALTKNPVKSAAALYFGFQGAIGVVLNMLANKDLLKEGKLGAFFGNPSLWVNAGIAAGSLELLTGIKGLGSGIVSKAIFKLRGDLLKEEVEGTKINEFVGNYTSYVGTGRYLKNNFENIKSYVDEKQEQMLQMREEVKAKTRTAETMPKNFMDFLKQDLEVEEGESDTRPEFMKTLNGMDGFNREETLEKLITMYLFTKFAKEPPQKATEFEEFVEKILNPGTQIS